MKAKTQNTNTEGNANLKKALMKILLDLNIDLPDVESPPALLQLIEEDYTENESHQQNNNKMEQAENPENKQ
jgi:hypothetical protein